MANKIKSFEDLHIWQDSMKLCMDIYEGLNSCKDFGLRDQIQKSVISIPSNLAEGFERETPKELIRFLYYAKGSSGELRTQLYIAKEQKRIDSDKCIFFIDRTKRIASMIQNLIKSQKAILKLKSP